MEFLYSAFWKFSESGAGPLLMVSSYGEIVSVRHFTSPRTATVPFTRPRKQRHGVSRTNKNNQVHIMMCICPDPLIVDKATSISRHETEVDEEEIS
jgi:hypothetical protein